MRTMKNLISLLMLATFTSACAVAPSGISGSLADAMELRQVKNPGFAAIHWATEKVDKDRQAILAMQGEYDVDFHFNETVVLSDDYELRKEKNTGGYEVVIVVESAPEKIVLQHLLVTPSGHVIKHWRQDWMYEATRRLEFVAYQTWSLRPIKDELQKGRWTQCVFEVSDAPRYCGTGGWNHRYGVSTWTSDRSWRPLPRREYTIREDYNALNAENRHTVTPHGWTHEQDNTKTVREGTTTREVLVREFGFNDYRSVENFDFEPARVYWRETGAYWARVRAEWQRILSESGTLRLTTEVDGMPIIKGTFEQAEASTEMSAGEQLAAIKALLAAWTVSQVEGNSGSGHNLRPTSAAGE